MATINYVTLKLPEILWDNTEVITKTPSFEVRRYTYKKGIIFRIPNEVKPGEVCHAFIEHEVNMSNTLRTGTLTIKVQVTFIPCYMGVFSGFDHLEGSFKCDYEDEWYGEEYFVPDYKSDENKKNIVPLPVNMKSNLFEYLNEILFQHTDDSKIISQYAVALGCKTQTLKDNFMPVPVQTSHTNKGVRAYQKTINFFENISTGSENLLPENKEE